ncbi:MAG: hypothetical protein AAGA96_16640 [Verrucomicrobiota bacterium]
MSHVITAFPETQRRLAESIKDMRVDFEALRRPLKRCRLKTCGGTCCHDGVYLSNEEARVIRELPETMLESLKDLGLDLPDRTVVYGKWRDVAAGPKTATRHAEMSRLVANYPEHFGETQCVFLTADAKCGLQLVGAEEGLHPWHFKPATCWLHPLSMINDPDGSLILTLYSELNDPQRYEDYDGFVSKTHCGVTCHAGDPAWQVLSEEIKMLGEMGGRDLFGEIREKLSD